ncbi:hypothetical protein U9M48_002287 [Paspalum notatum var. saurae]|uniref:Uncharacterized protein n=1 Tax=Paspalum notatum var. saurae TaxID=547442 RepID=A0AAQ3PJ92_PASNO
MATSASAAAADHLPAPGPRKRGRPRKHADYRLPGVEATAAAEDHQASSSLAPRRRGRPRKHAVAAGEAPGSSLVSPPEAEEEAGGEYERERAARIRENMERMQKLGILDLAHTLAQSAAARRWRRKPVEPGSVRVDKPAAPAAPLRRSLRLAPALADQPAAPGPRRRGRPRKHSALADQPAAPGPRKRGRPRKHPAAAEQLAAAMVLRKRGRPRKHAVAVEAPASPVSPPEEEAEVGYERERAQQIPENMEPMQ